MLVSSRKKLQEALFNTHTTISVAGHDVANVLDGRVPRTLALTKPMHKTAYEVYCKLYCKTRLQYTGLEALAS